MSCGNTSTAACTTLDQVLSLHYKTNHTSQMDLQIITLKSLTIDEEITVSKSFLKMRANPMQCVNECFFLSAMIL